MKMIIALAASLVLALTAGCASMSAPNMTAEQLRAAAADKNFAAACSTVTGVWGTGRVVYVNVDRTVVTNGAISVDPNCVVTMSNSPVPKAEPASVATPATPKP